jgi:rSAM/selenodomain-associated transferase 1
MARAPEPGRCKTRLEPLLGPDGCARLQAVLLRRAAAWAADVADGAFVAYDGDRAAVAACVPEGVRLLPQRGEDFGERLRNAVADAFAGAPLLVVGTDLPRLGAEHAVAAFADLAAGADVTLGPAADGGYYLIGLAAPRPELFALPAEAWGGPTVLPRTLAAAHELGLEVGMLRMERDLDTPRDARALLADPLTPAEVAAALRP